MRVQSILLFVVLSKKYCGKNSQTKILKNKSNPNDIFLITSSRVFVKINGGERYSISQVWNFSNYVMKDNSNDEGEELSDSGITIFPALYPLSRSKKCNCSGSEVVYVLFRRR